MSDTTTVHGDTSHGGVFRFGQPEWRVRDPEPFRRCSYCGSMHPEDFVAAAQAGAEVDRGVDWKYGWPHKVYVDVPVSDPSMLFCVGGSSGGDRDRDPGPGYVHVSELTDEQIAIALRDGSIRPDDELSTDVARWLMFGTRTNHHAKYYSIHTIEPWVSDELRDQIGFYTGWLYTTGEKPGTISYRHYPYDITR
jgi:hypothetical protein